MGSSSGNGILVRVGVLMCITVVIKALGPPISPWVIRHRDARCGLLRCGVMSLIQSRDRDNSPAVLQPASGVVVSKGISARGVYKQAPTQVYVDNSALFLNTP